MARPWKIALCLIIAMFTFSAGSISYVIYQRQKDLSGVARYNIAWSASQAAIELTRLQHQLALAVNDPDPDVVQLRYNILLNRMALLNSGDFRNFIRTDESSQAAVAALSATLPQLDPLIAGMTADATSNASVLEKAQALLAPLTPALLRLAAAANRYGSDQVAADQHMLIRLHWQFSGIVAGMILCAAALIVLLLWHNRMLERAHGTLRRMTRKLQSTTVSRILLDAALNNMSQGLCMVDAEQRLIVSNGNFRSLLRLPTAQLASGRRFADLLELPTTTGDLHNLLVAQLALARGEAAASAQEELTDGRIIAITHQPMEAGGWVATYEDVTERRRAQDRVAHLARHDVLTGLPNRLLFREEMERAMARTRRHREGYTLLCLDLDHFKPVNDTLGHPAGDILLRLVAARLRACARDTDLVARLGGDEFAIIQVGVPDPAAAAGLASRAIATLSAPFDVEGHEVVITVSAGIALAPQDGSDVDELMKNADLALYRAKGQERGTFRFFEPEMDLQARERRFLELELHRAVAQNEFEVFYQPLFNLARNEICGFEALLRWRHPEKGLLSPALFIPVAEEIGMIATLGEWVLQQACAEAATWPGAIKVAINLSAVQFRAPQRLLAAVREALRSSGLPTSRLELEITETVLLQEDDTTLALLHELRDLGVRISMDDFGTGYSSLSYLRTFPFNKIKIDKCFVAGLENSSETRAIVRAITTLAASLGMSTTAEGVETRGQFDHLRLEGCTEIQGYLISEAILPGDIKDLLLSVTARLRGVPDRRRLVLGEALAG